jgi:hypothetical protein
LALPDSRRVFSARLPEYWGGRILNIEPVLMAEVNSRGRSMRGDRTMRSAVAVLAAVVALLAWASPAWAQEAQSQQSQSVAEAARQAREAKKNAAKPSKVISDDDIDTRSVKPGAEGLNVGTAPKSDAQPPSSAAVSAVEAADAATAAAEKNPPVKPGDDPETARAKEQVAEAAKELDLLKRGMALDQDSYYSKPDFASDKDGKAKLDGEQQKVNDAQQEVDRLKAHVAELEEARKHKKAASGEAAGSGTPDTEKPAEPPPATPPPSSPQS